MRRHGRRSHVPLVVVLGWAGLVLAGCGGSGGSSAGGAPTTGTPEASATADASPQPLLQIVVGGGFGVAGSDFARPPELTVYQDGGAITHGPQIAIYPPPALPNLLEYSLTDEQLQAVVDEAESAGLLEDPTPDYGRPPIADAPTTTVVLHVDGQEYRHTAESFDVGRYGTAGADDAGDDGVVVVPEGTSEPESELTDEQRQARQALAAFFDGAREIVTSSGEGELYEIQAFAVLARPASDDAAQAPDGGAADGQVAPPEGDIQPAVLAWPLEEVPLADATGCVTVDGQDAQTLRESLGQADALTRFESDGTVHDVWARPLLPHEESCEDVQSMLAVP